MKMRRYLILLLILALSSLTHVDAESIKTRIETEAPVLLQKALGNPAIFKKEWLEKQMIKPMRIRSIEPLSKENAIDVFQITYESWENGNWEVTDRYTLSSSLLPAAEDLSDYEFLLILMVYMLMSSGTEGDMGVTLGYLAPLLTIHNMIFAVITQFQYAYHEEYADGVWTPDYRLTSQLNANDEPTVILMEAYEEGTWISLMRTTLNYTEGAIAGGSSRIASATMQVTSEQDYGVLTNVFQFELTYVPAGLKRLLLRLWVSPLSQWSDGARLTYTYDQELAENAIIELSVTNGMTWFEIYKVFYTYANNLMTESLTETVDLSALSATMPDPSEPLEFENDSRETMAYDIHGNLVEWISYSWIVDYWAAIDKETYSYDANQHLLRVDTFYGDYNYWEPDERLDYSYSGDLLTQASYFNWAGYDFDEENRTTYAYNGQNQLTTIIYQEDDGSGMTNDVRKIYTYEGITEVDQPVHSARPEHFSISNYPNPFNAGTMIRFNLPERLQVSVDVFNVSGQKIIRLFNGIAPSGENTIPWQGLNNYGQPVPTGIYLIRVTTGQTTLSQRCLLLK